MRLWNVREVFNAIVGISFQCLFKVRMAYIQQYILLMQTILYQLRIVMNLFSQLVYFFMNVDCCFYCRSGNAQQSFNPAADEIEVCICIVIYWLCLHILLIQLVIVSHPFYTVHSPCKTSIRQDRLLHLV